MRPFQQKHKKENRSIRNKLISILLIISTLLSITYVGMYNASVIAAGSGAEIPDVFGGDLPLTPAPTWEEFTDQSGAYQYTEKVYVSFDEYLSKYATAERYDENTTIIRIDNAEQLHKFSQKTNDNDMNISRHFLSLHYVLGNNIDYAAYADNNNSKYFIPIGHGEENGANDIPFTGIFDGQGFDITNLYFATDITTVAQHQYFALFSANRGTVKNFGLISPVINTRSNIGGMYVSGIVGKNLSGGVVEYVFVDITAYETPATSGYLSDQSRVAGIASFNEAGGKISNAYYSGSVVPTPHTAVYVRPLVGVNDGTVEELFYNTTRYSSSNIAPEGTGTGSVTGVSEDNLYKRTNCLSDPKWRRREYSQAHATALASYMKELPRLSGFTAWPGVGNNQWGGSVYPFVILTPADLVYFPQFIAGAATPNTNVTNKTYHIAACIDMSSVSEEAYYFPNMPNLTGTVEALRNTEKDLAESGWCEPYHHHHGENHAIVNLKMVRMLTGTAGTYNDAKMLGFFPYTSATGSIKDITFIGGLAKPRIAETDLAGYHFIGTVTGYSSASLTNVHSSMSVIMPDGPAPYFAAGGLRGVVVGVTTYSSFSGSVSGGIHPYNALMPPESNYNVGGIFGQVLDTAAAKASPSTVLLNTGTLEGCGFYDLPNPLPETPSAGTVTSAGVTVGGLAGGYIALVRQNREERVSPEFVNKGEIYSLPMNADKTGARNGPDGKTVYAYNAAIGGMFASGQQIYFDVENSFSKNLGDIYGYNLTGASGVAGCIGYVYRVTHGDPSTCFINYGDIIIKNSTGRVVASGIFSRSFESNSRISDVNHVYNFGNIDVDASNNLSQCIVGGISAREQYANSYSSILYNVANYGDITLDIRSDSCETVAAGLIANQSHTVNNGTAFNGAKNFGDITIKTSQNNGIIKASGLGSAKMERCVNKGNITIEATGNLTDSIYVGGISPAMQTISVFNEVINAGDISVSAKTSGMIYAGGVYGYANAGSPSVAGSYNFGKINIENRGSGGAVAGGLAGYYSGASNPEIYDSVNSGDIRVKTVGSDESTLSTVAGGLAGIMVTTHNNSTTPATMLRNSINYGAVSSQTTSAAAGVCQYTGGAAGYATSSVNGLMNHGEVATVTATPDARNTMTGGMIGYHSGTTRSASLTNLVNYGDITQSSGSYKGAILGYGAFITNGTYDAGTMWTNHINTSDSASMYGGTNGLDSDTNYNRFTWKNIATVYSGDIYLIGTPARQSPFNGLVKLYTNDDESGGIYSEGFFLRSGSSDASSCLIYNENVNLASARMNNFPTGMYAVTAKGYFDAQLYLPDATTLKNFDGLPVNDDTDAETTWRTDDKKDESGNPIAGTSVEDRYAFVRQVDNEPKIITLSIFSAKTEYDIAHTIKDIQTRDDKEKILYFYTTENLLGRDFIISDYTTSAGVLASSPEGAPLSETVLRATVDGAEADIFVFDPDGEFEPVKYTVKLVHLADPKITSLRISASSATSLVKNWIPNEDLVIDNSNPDYPVYVIKDPVYTYSTYKDPLFYFYITTENIENDFSFYHHVTFARDDNNEDYTGRFVGGLEDSGYWKAMYYAPEDKYRSKESDAATAPGTVRANTNVYSAEGVYVPAGTYTMKVTVNGKVLLAIRFEKAEEGIPMPKEDAHYTVTMGSTEEESFVERTNLMFGASSEKSRAYYLYAPLTNGLVDHGLGTLDGATVEKSLITNIEQHANGTHTFTNKLKLVSPGGIVWWWTLYTTEEKTMTSSVTNARLNDTMVGDGTGNTIVVSNETRVNEIKLSHNISQIDIYNPNCFESKVLYFDGTSEHILTRKPGTTAAAPTYQLNGVDVLSVTQTRGAHTATANNSNGRYDYVMTLTADAPAGNYSVYPIYKRSQNISMGVWNSADNFTENTHAETVSWFHEFETPFVITKPRGSDSYLQAVTFEDALLETIRCITAGHNHAVNPAYVDSNGIHYSTLPTKGPERCTDFEYVAYILDNTIDLTNYNVEMKLSVGAKLSISDGASGWIPVPANHTADYANGPVQYKVVSEDFENETFYTFRISGMEENKSFKIDALAGDGIDDLQKEITESGKNLYITIKQVDSQNEVIRVINGCFIGNNGLVLPYEFPEVTAGTYVIDASIPDDCEFTLTLSDEECTETIRGILGVVFVLTEPLEIQRLNLNIIISKVKPKVLPWGLYSFWNCIYRIQPAKNYDVVFDRNGEFGRTLFNQDPDYENIIISPLVGVYNDYKNAYINGKVTVSPGVEVTGNIFATGNVEIYGRVIGDIHSEGTIIIKPGGSYTGQLFGNSINENG